MKTYTIGKKMSGTGTIHDIASDICDREINFKHGDLYAVVVAAYYGNGGFYTVHRSEAAAIRKSRSLREYSHAIIDADGNHYQPDGDRLRRVD